MNNTVKFWVVTRPTPHSTVEDILFESDAQGMIRQGLGGLKPGDVLATFRVADYDKALEFAKAALTKVSQ